MTRAILGNFKGGFTRLTLGGKWTPTVDTAISLNNWDLISIDGVDWHSYEPLLPYANNIKWLRVSLGPDSSKGLDMLTGLEKLALNDYPKPAPDFRKLPNLRELEVLWDISRKSSYLANSNLESLSVDKLGDSDLTAFEELTKLRQFKILQGSLKSLKGIDKLHSLLSLNLILLRRFNDLSELKHAKSLEVLETDSLPNLLEVDAIKELSNLKRLELDAPKATIDNLDWIGSMPKLEKLMLSVMAKSINWQIIANHPSLTWLSIVTHEGYDKTDDEIQNMLNICWPIKRFMRLKCKIPSFVVEW